PIYVRHALAAVPTRRSSDLARKQRELPGRGALQAQVRAVLSRRIRGRDLPARGAVLQGARQPRVACRAASGGLSQAARARRVPPDRKSTRLNSSHVKISYAV